VLKLIPLLALSLSSTYGQARFAVRIGWLPITDEERRQSAPTVDPDAGLEALFWRVHVLDEFKGDQDIERDLYHYVRLKIFNEKGKERAATIEIPAGRKEVSIVDIAGRTVKPDGTVLELKRDAIFTRDVVRAGGLKRKVKSFAMPGVEPGAIVEYRWKEVRFNAPMMYIRLQMQQEYPVRRVTYLVKPLPLDYSNGYQMSLWPFNCKPSPAQADRDGFHATTLENVPAYKEEPLMPGDANVRPWVLAYYHQDSKRDPDKYWEDEGKRAYKRLKGSLKVTDEIKAAAEKAVAGAGDDSEKSLALMRYLRKNLRGLYDRSVTDAERAAVIKSLPKSRYRTSAEVFKSGIGTADELNTLFAAMASSVGLEARPVLVSNRDDVAFHPSLADSYFLPNVDMGVKIGEDWRLFDVSTRLLPPHMLGWREEGAQALLSDPKKPRFIFSACSPPEASATRRTAEFSLATDGTLEGDITENYSGHTAAHERGDLEDQEPAKQIEDVKERIAKRFPQAEISAIQVQGVDTSEAPLVVRYHVKIPNYAQRTGKRLLFQPLFFQRGESPLFESADRRHDVVFPYGFQEADQVTIKLPDGFTLDNAENPGSLEFGKPGGYKLELAINQQGDLLAKRELIFGRLGILQFPLKSYPQLKKVFDEVHSRDGLTLSLKQDAK